VIAARTEVSGPVQVSPVGRTAVVAGQTVVLAAGTVAGETLRPGEWVTVSGLADPAGAIHATRIDRRAPGPVSVSGLLVRSGRQAMIGALSLHAPALPAADRRITSAAITPMERSASARCTRTRCCCSRRAFTTSSSGRSPRPKATGSHWRPG
jgi:hypothetical protein